MVAGTLNVTERSDCTLVLIAELLLSTATELLLTVGHTTVVAAAMGVGRTAFQNATWVLRTVPHGTVVGTLKLTVYW